MWIIPSNHPLYSAFAPEFLASREDLQELASKPVSWPTWKSKPTSVQTWLRAWKRVYWIPHLFGRMLKPSMHAPFVDEYTASLAVIHAPENRLPGYEKGISIMDSFGRIYAELSRQQDLFGHSSKMWMTTLRERIRLYTAAYEIWVTQLRRESILRRKLARHMSGKDYSSLHWRTPMSQDFGGSGRMDFSDKLSVQAKNWPTAAAANWRDGASNQHGKNSRPLNEVVQLWPTPYASMERKYKLKKGGQSADRNLSAMARRGEMNGQQDKEDFNMNGNILGQLNPAWVAQLMGTTLEKIFFVPLATQWLSRPQK